MSSRSRLEFIFIQYLMRTMEKVAMSNQRVREWSGTPGHGAISRGSDGLKEDLMGENVMQEFSIINIAGLKLWKQNWIYRRISICCSRSREIWEILASSWHGTWFQKNVEFYFVQMKLTYRWTLQKDDPSSFGARREAGPQIWEGGPGCPAQEQAENSR